MRSPEEILALYHGRKDRLAATHAVLRNIRAGILGEIDIPLPELDRNERPAVANLMLVGVTQTAGRIASTMPDPYYPPVKPGIILSEDKARTRRARILDYYDKNNMKTMLRRRAHHYLAYAASPMVTKPNPRYMEGDQSQSPVLWQLYDPLNTYPADLPIGQVVPDDVVFTYTRSYSWIEERYGQGVLAALSMANRNPDQQITILEYIDRDVLCLYAISTATEATQPSDRGPMYGIIGNSGVMKRPPGKQIVPLYPEMTNRAGRPLCVIAGLIGLERPQSMYEGLVGLFQTQSKLMALEVIGMMRSIWPEEWGVTRQGETMNIVTQADPIAGVIGEISGADIHINAPQPAQFGVNIVDRMERAQRVQGGIPAEYGGESATNTRTDKRGNSILSATIDYTIQAAHEAFEVSMRAENMNAAAIEKAYFPGKKTFFSTLGQSTYVPAELWEPNAVGYVKYSHAGVDQQGLVVEGGQRLGIGTISKRSFMEIDPLVDDPELETERVRSEMLEAMFFQSLTALMQQDPNYVTVIAQLDALLREDKAQNVMSSWLALDKKYKDAQQQAQQQAPPGAEAQPGAGQPGLAQPDAGQIGPPGGDLSNLGKLAQVLRHTSRSPEPAMPSGGPGMLQGATGGP
jgi:hypothetical protein